MKNGDNTVAQTGQVDSRLSAFAEWLHNFCKKKKIFFQFSLSDIRRTL